MFRYFAIMLCGLIGFLGLLLGVLKVFQPDLQMQSQTTSGAMMSQPLPSALILFGAGLAFVVATYLLKRYWHPRTPLQ